MKLKRYAVTVMDNWTPMRTFWTLAGARSWRARLNFSYTYLYRWESGMWFEVDIQRR